MKRISLLRHAQAADRTAQMRDIDRPLTAKGRKDAALIGGFIAARSHRPDLALSSPSARTRETLEAVCSRLSKPPHLIFKDALYNATAQQLLDAVRASSDQFAHLLLVGHNPGMHQIALELAVRCGERAVERLRRSFPKGALAEFELDIASWRETGDATGALADFIRPKQLRS